MSLRDRPRALLCALRRHLLAVRRRAGDALARRGILRRHVALAVCLLVALGFGLLGAYISNCGLRGCPSATEIRAFRPTEGSRVLDRDGVMLGRLSYVRRINVPLERVPRHVRAAFIATEDRRFYRHDGVDWRSAVRATARNIGSLGVREGFSTITMQVVRSAFIPELANGRTLRRKLIELGMARRLEDALEKQEILALYLNVLYLGNGTYGVEAASRDLFGKGVERLSLAEAATLAAMAKGPAYYSPRRHPERARARRDLVLGLMAREGYITAAQAERARRSPVKVARGGWRPPQDTSWALDPVRAVVDSILERRDEEVGDLVVRTTLVARAQRAAEAAVRQQARAIERSTGARAGSIEGALVAIDPRDGGIRALVGARRYTRGGFNRALAARRQPGSAFKPFVYAAALARGVTTATLVDDSPVEVDLPEGTTWRPANFGGENGGELTVRSALTQSANAATVRLSRAIGEERVVDLARRAGIRSPLPAVPALALGAAEVTPLELVAAYAPFANGGLRVRPSLVTRIEAADGTVLWEAPAVDPAAKGSDRVLDERDAFLVTSMLRSVVDEGTGHSVRDLGVRGPVAGKTGTTNDGADVWFVGYTPTVVAGVWFGYDTPRPIASNASGGRFAAPAWAAFYRRGWRESGEEADWAPPPGMVSLDIDAFNGDLANEWCPVTRREWFKLGTEPTRVCEEHHPTFFEEIESIGRKLGRAIGKLFSF